MKLAALAAVLAAVPLVNAQTSSVSGKVSFAGAPPAPGRVAVRGDPRCEQLHPQGLEVATVAVADGGLGNALVWLKSGVSGPHPAPAEAVVLDQRNCEFVPRHVAVRTGQTLSIRNSDDTLHNVHPRPQANAEFNLGQPRRGMESPRKFDRPELMIPVGCDIHPWMKAYVSVISHPFFAMTRPDGTYEIAGVPPGDYEIEVVHETLGSRAQPLTVKGGEGARADFVFGQ
jgi:plastocyanin